MEDMNIESTEPRINFPAVAKAQTELEELLCLVPESVGRLSAKALTIVHLELGKYVHSEDSEPEIVKKVLKHMLVELHPDTERGDAEQFNIVSNVYNTIKRDTIHEDQ